MNTKGLGDENKRVQVFSWLHNRPADIFFVQETHSTIESENKWKENWGNNNMFFSHGTSNARGVGIFFKNFCDMKINKEYHDDDGRIIILDISLNDEQLTLINIYGPNIDNPIFFENICGKLQDFNCESIIWGGDFNLVLDVSLDKKGGIPRTHHNSQNCVKGIMEDYDLIDIWRKKNPTTRRYTWRSNTNPPILCRLDFFLISFNLYAQIDHCNILAGFKTDHSSIDIKVASVNEARGRGFWKFNVSLLHDMDYVNKIKQCIQDVNINCRYMTPDILWEFMKCQIRTVTIEYSAKISKTRKIHEKKLVNEINDLESTYAANPSDEVLNKIHKCNIDLEALYKIKTNGCIVRSRANCVEYGERNSRYFINLEKRNQKQKVITKLITDNGDVLTSGNDILNEEKAFYQQLYSSCNPDHCNLNDLLDNADVPKLDNNLSSSCEGLISVKE